MGNICSVFETVMKKFANIVAPRSPSLQDLQQSTSISEDIQWYRITDIVIECTPEDVDRPGPTTMDVKIVSPQRNTEQLLTLEKVSSVKWQENKGIKLDEGRFIATWDETGSVGSIDLPKVKLEEFVTSATAGSDGVVVEQEFAMETNNHDLGFKLRLSFGISRTVSDEKLLQRIKELLRHETENAEELKMVFKMVLELPDTMLDKLHCLDAYGKFFLTHFEDTGCKEDAENCILAYKAYLTLQNHANQSIWLSSLGNLFPSHFECKRDLTVISEAISSYQNAVIPNSDRGFDMPSWLTCLGCLFQRHSEQTKKVTYISKAISLHENAVCLTPQAHVDMPSRLSNLGNSFKSRFEFNRNSDDILAANRNSDDILAAILYQQGALYLTSEDADRPRRLNDIGDSFQFRFKDQGDTRDICQAILFREKAVELTPENHVDRPGWLTSLGNALEIYSKHKDKTSISRAISLHNEALATVQNNAEQNRAAILNNLGNALQIRFEFEGNLEDISQAILFLQEAVEQTADSHPDKPSRLHNLGVKFLKRSEYREDSSDISKSICCLQKAVELTPEGHGNKPNRLNSLGNSLLSHFNYTKNLDDISKAILAFKEAVNYTHQDQEDRPRFLVGLGKAFQKRFECTRNKNDIYVALSSHLEAVELTDPEHEAFSRRQNNLGNSYEIMFQYTGDVSDISKAISCHQKAVDLSRRDVDFFRHLNSLGRSLSSHFKCTGDSSDISASISSLQKALDFTPKGCRDRPDQLNNLGNSFQICFQHTGYLADISKAISLHQEAVLLTPEGYTGMPSRLNNLGNSLIERFKYNEDINDISEAISNFKKAVRLTPDYHANRSDYLNNLGVAYQSCFKYSKDFSDISQSISHLQEAVNLTPEDHKNMPSWLNNLGISFLRSFDCKEDTTHITKAVSLHKKAVDLTSEKHVNLPYLLNNLGISLQSHFKHKKNLNEISEAILSHQKAVELTSEKHATRPALLKNLGNSFQSRFEYTKDPSDSVMAICKYHQAAICPSGPPSERLEAAMQWAKLSQSLDAYNIAIELISQVIGLEQTIQRRYTRLIDISDLAGSAAACAIKLGRPDLALEWLEHGRCLVWNQLNNLRTPLDALSAHNTEIAEDVLRVSRALDKAGSRTELFFSPDEATIEQKISIQVEVDAHVELAEKWKQLLITVRAIPGFEDFLKPPSCSNLLKHLPDSGFIVVINVHKDSLCCDALVLRSGLDTPQHIFLPKFSYANATDLCKELDNCLRFSNRQMHEYKHDNRTMYLSSGHSGGVLEKILRKLWDSVVKPIIDGLGCSDSLSNPPRIWWCATGPLAFLPIHAAGIYATSKTEAGSTLSDFAISSYIPNVRTLTERVKAPQIDNKKAALFMISQPKMLNQPDLCTTEEVQAIKHLLQNHDVKVLCLDGEAATVGQSIKNMETHSCIHFACHAMQNNNEPLKSKFMLHDGGLELSEIIKKQLAEVDLAYLSACQTSTGDKRLSDEAVHLAAGMLAAGYRGVVATMWNIGDKFGQDIAKDFYTKLIIHEAKKEDFKLSSKNGAHALHCAIQKLRKEYDNSESSLLLWVPYVYFGL